MENLNQGTTGIDFMSIVYGTNQIRDNKQDARLPENSHAVPERPAATVFNLVRMLHN